MNRSFWDTTLRQFKENEQPEAVLFVADNADMIQVVVAWMNTPISKAKRVNRPKNRKGEELWQWLWENSDFSREEFYKRLPLKIPNVENKLNALIANRVIYPDGSTNGYVAKYLRERIVKLFAKSAQKPK